jgi:glycosyltransferase involved in cell wall biosynthesis
MKTSAIIPAYNSEKTIYQTIESLLNQTHKFNEIIIVDDGSQDKTSEIISKFPVKLIKKERGGESSALNVGIKQAEGDYIAIIEADVILPRDWLEGLLKELKGIVCGAGAVLKVANPDNLIAKLSGYELEYRYYNIKDKYVFHITSANTLYKKEVFKEVGYYDESLVNAGLDAELNARLIKKGYKLVLRKDIKVKHFWKTNLISYLKRQFAYSFYRPFQKNNFLYPTDKKIILEMILIFLLIFSLFIRIFIRFPSIILLSILLFFFVIQFITALRIFYFKKDFDVFYLMPLIFIRDIFVFFGYSLGFFYKTIKLKK